MRRVQYRSSYFKAIMTMSTTYSAKILLFGEYLLIHGGNALALPKQDNNGKWSFEDPPNQRDLFDFCQYIQSLQQTNKMAKVIDTATWEKDLKQGLWFDANIPEGYGVGSSGALVAAVYDRYVMKGKRQTDTEQLKSIFAVIESYFHGNSSGFDPLVSYLNQQLLLRSNGQVQLINQEWSKEHDYQLFLIDTGRKRQTAPLVKKYLRDCEDDFFLDRVKSKIIPTSNACINAFINQKQDLLFQEMKTLSAYQFQNFKSMIPNEYWALWKEGIEQSEFTLKLCGAGGGGYILGMGTDAEIKSLKRKLAIEPLIFHHSLY